MSYQLIQTTFSKQISMQRLAFLLFAMAMLSFSQGALCQNLPVGILPMAYNPSFAGSAGGSRMVANFSYEHQKFSHQSDKDIGVSLSYDNFIPWLRSGVGIIASWNRGDRLYQSRSHDRQSGFLSLIIAPKISIKGKYTISPSLQLGYTDIYHEYYSSPAGYLYKGFQGQMGILFNANNYYIGYGLRLFNSPDDGFFYNEKLYSAIQLGYCFRKSSDAQFSFTPQFVLPIIIYSEFTFIEPNYLLNFRFGQYSLGAVSTFGYWYPTGFLAGWQKSDWRIVLTNQFKDQYSSRASAYRLDLSLRYIFNSDKKSLHVFD
jgi:hypothetical protein